MTDQEVLAALVRIENRLGEMSTQIAELKTVRATAPHSSGGGGAIADDALLDGQYGNPEIRKDPPRWDGPKHTGEHMADVHDPAYLESLAGFLDWQASKDDEKPGDDKYSKDDLKKFAWYKRQDASKARGYAKRLRESNKTTHPVASAVQDDDSMPF